MLHVLKIYTFSFHVQQIFDKNYIVVYDRFVMNLKLSFSWIGIVVFALPMLINIAFVIFPPTGEQSEPKKVNRIFEIVEQVSRIAYLLALTFLVSQNPLDLRNVLFYFAAAFLILYYVVWLRYFIGGRNVELLGKPFLFVPMPLAVFPVLYFLCAAIWMSNLPAAIIMIVFGIAHITVSVRSF